MKENKLSRSRREAKKSALAGGQARSTKAVLACLALTAAGCASAQSSATIFGIVDIAAKYGTASGPGSASRSSLGSGSFNASRLGFRVDEDLGGGLRAGAWLEAGINADNGTGGVMSTNNQKSGLVSSGGLMFDRRATVSLSDARWGEFRMGRDFTPQFWNTCNDPFACSGAGMPVTMPGNINGAAGLVPSSYSTSVRASNTVSYFLPPTLGGVFGQVQYYFGENAHNGVAGEKDGSGFAGRLGYAAGPIKVSVATGTTKYATGDARQTNAGLNWELSRVALSAHITHDRLGTASGRGWMLGAIVPFGTLDVKGSYSRYSIDTGTSTPRVSKLALGLQENLSKRTALYATWASVRNTGGSAVTLNSAVAGSPNQNSSGVDLGIRHSF
jgi:predicted porin